MQQFLRSQPAAQWGQESLSWCGPTAAKIRQVLLTITFFINQYEILAHVYPALYSSNKGLSEDHCTHIVEAQANRIQVQLFTFKTSLLKARVAIVSPEITMAAGLAWRIWLMMSL